MASELEELLKRGIAAAKAGEREMARDLLMRIVEQDERNIKAWLWLSSVVDRPDDRQICLENVLAIDPDNQVARRGLELLLKETGLPSRPGPAPSAPGYTRGRVVALTPASAILHGPPAAPAPPEEPAPAAAGYTPPPIEEGYAYSTRPPPTLAAALLRKTPEPPEGGRRAVAEPSTPARVAPAAASYPSVPRWSEVEQDAQTLMSEFADEYLCPYCAEPTKPDDVKCAACGGSLWQSAPRSRERSGCLSALVFLIILGTGWQLFPFLTAGFVFIQPFFREGKITLDQFVGLYLGLPTAPPDVAQAIFERLPPSSLWLLVLVIGIQLGVAVLIYFRWQPIYWVALGLAGLSLLYAVLSAVTAPQVGLGHAAGVLLALLVVLLLFRLQADFTKQHERLLCQLDKDIRSHSGFYMRGREYARKKMWTLAVIHFQRARANAPRQLAYHIALADAYVELKRYERARSVLQDAQRLEPDNPDVRLRVELVAQERARYAGA